MKNNYKKIIAKIREQLSEEQLSLVQEVGAALERFRISVEHFQAYHLGRSKALAGQTIGSPRANSCAAEILKQSQGEFTALETAVKQSIATLAEFQMRKAYMDKVLDAIDAAQDHNALPDLGRSRLLLLAEDK